MPTGYTAIIEEPGGCTFETYLLRCARAFGACVMQRDDPMTDPPKPREPSDYHRKELERGTARLRELSTMTPEQADVLWRAGVARDEKANAEYLAEHDRLTQAYTSMRAEVEAWVPPTKDHDGLKKFMLDQLRISREYSDPPYQRPVAASAAAWLADQVEAIDLPYHARKHAEEVARCEESNAWTKALYDSLPSRRAK